MKHRGLCRIAMTIAAIMLPVSLFASGFMIYNQDPKATGMGLATVASIDNPSAVFYNPALLTDLKGANISVGDTMIMIERSFKDSNTGMSIQAKTTTHHVPSLFAGYTNGNWAYGMGIYSPFGLSLEWPSYWSGRYSSTFAELKTYYINPTVAYKFNEYLSVGFGISYVESSVDFQNALNLAPFPDGKARMTADGQGIGFNGAIALKLPKGYTAALTYRSPVHLHYHGEARFYVHPAIKSLLPDGDITTNITLPHWTTFAVAKQTGALTLEADIIYVGWSTIDSFTVRFDDGRPQSSQWKKWHNMFCYALGANYRWSDSLETQLGYMYDMSPVPKRSLTPELPGSASHLVTGGIGYRKGPFHANVAYQAILYEKADSTGNIVGAPRGSYDTLIHSILISLSYSL